MKRVAYLVVAIFLLGTANIAQSADAPANAIHVEAAGSHPSEWSVARLEKEFAGQMKTVRFTNHDRVYSGQCVSLLALLKAAGVETDLKMDPKADPHVKNRPMRMAVVIAGRDGYVATLSLGELMAGVGHTEAWLVVEVDGHALPAAEGPARLIVPTDSKPARWVRAVDTIAVVDGAAAATQPK